MLQIRYFKDIIKQVSNSLSNLTDNNNWHQHIFLTVLNISHLLFFIAFTGAITLDPSYLAGIETFVRYYVSIILMIRFNPFVDRQVTKFDKRIVFTSALLLFISTTAFTLANNYFKRFNPLTPLTNIKE